MKISSSDRLDMVGETRLIRQSQTSGRRCRSKKGSPRGGEATVRKRSHTLHWMRNTVIVRCWIRKTADHSLFNSEKSNPLIPRCGPHSGNRQAASVPL